MVAELGHFALILALFIALAQAIVPLWGAHKGDVVMMNAARPGALGLFLLVTLAFGCLTYAYITSDFSVANVYENSHTDKPMLYKISGVWGNHEGSLLLWITILSLFGLAVALAGSNIPPQLRARALSVQAMITVGFLLFILFTSNPFLRLDPVPLNGRGLNPLLQDPGLAFHPPMLYLGYVGFSMAFSFAVAALIEGRVDAAWARWVRPWTLAAWTFLTLGIGLGSWWAYYELGWGGWWFWDPVENASFMPWLVGTALLHSAIVVEKRDSLKSWTILLAILAFAMSLLGTFLVRSGVITSVHAFASDPTRGMFILILLAVSVGGSLTLYAWRAPSLKGGGLFAPISREGALLVNNLLMTTAAATVLLGTLYPMIADLFELGKVSVGPPFFNGVFVPLMVPMLIVMGVGPFMAWKRGDLMGGLSRLWGAAGAFLAVTLGVWAWNGGDLSQLLAAFGMGLAAYLLIASLTEWAGRIKLFRAPLAESLRRAGNLPRAAWGMTLAHIGIALVVAGVTASSAWKQEMVQTQAVGETLAMAGYDITLTGVHTTDGPNYSAVEGTFEVRKDGVLLSVLTPQKRAYRQPPMPTSEAAIHTTGFSDIYTVIGDAAKDGDGWVTRMYFEPLVPFLWYGVLLMALGGAISLSDRRHRVGAPVRRRAATAAAPGSGKKAKA
jgi:cytochrome c-type biogenesis protein CcmF